MNYELMWTSLRQEMEYLQHQGVHDIHPVVVIQLMDDAYNQEDARDQMEAYIQIAAGKTQKGD